MKRAYLARGVYSSGKEYPDSGIVVDKGRVVLVSTNSEIKRAYPFIRKQEVDGFIYPAAVDSHVHLKELALSLISVNAGSMDSFNTLLALILESTYDPLYIYNFDFNIVKPEEWLKLFKTEKRVFIQSKDVHSVFVSRAFLKEKGILPRVVSGGELLFVEGEFAGVLRDKACELVLEISDRPFKSEYFATLDEYFLSRGIVCVTNFDCNMLEMADALKKSFKPRVVQAIHKDAIFEAVRNGIKTGNGDSKLRYGPVKLFLDGSLGSQTAWMFTRKPFKGLMTMTQTELEERTRYANSNGLEIAVHAIGSGATHAAMEVFSRVERIVTNRIEHLQFIEEEHLHLLKKGKFVASMQPLHAISDFNLCMKYFKDFKLAYAWNTVRNSGKMLVFGSDAPVEDASVLKGLFAATTRVVSKDGTTFLPEEALDISTAIDAYTVNGYKAAHFGEEFGDLRKGSVADFMVLKNSLLDGEMSRESLLENEVLKTYMDGREVWTK